MGFLTFLGVVIGWFASGIIILTCIFLIIHALVTGWYPGCGRDFWSNWPE